ncbi:MAG: DUF6036 family nucleotidyltransferase [bacterium]
MVDPSDIPRIVSDAARLLRRGELVVFGSAALAYWLENPPRTRDVDVWCSPAAEGDAIQALMGELSWYDEKHGAYVEVWAPETFSAPSDWRRRARVLQSDERPAVTVIVAHPHDVLLAKLERLDPHDLEHAERILCEYPLDSKALDALLAKSPYRTRVIVETDRRERFEHGVTKLRQMLARS